jgi:cytoskeletal protein CcmA (bactofilin family)
MADTSQARPDEFSTVIGSDAQFKGELSFQGGVRIDGKFEGTIQTPGRVLVSKGGVLKAEVRAGGLLLDGTIEGNVAAEDRAEIRASGVLTGDLKATKLLVQEGATIVGRCEVGPGATAKSGAPSADAAMGPVPAIPRARH